MSTRDERQDRAHAGADGDEVGGGLRQGSTQAGYCRQALKRIKWQHQKPIRDQAGWPDQPANRLVLSPKGFNCRPNDTRRGSRGRGRDSEYGDVPHCDRCALSKTVRGDGTRSTRLVLSYSAQAADSTTRNRRDGILDRRQMKASHVLLISPEKCAGQYKFCCMASGVLWMAPAYRRGEAETSI